MNIVAFVIFTLLYYIKFVVNGINFFLLDFLIPIYLLIYIIKNKYKINYNKKLLVLGIFLIYMILNTLLVNNNIFLQVKTIGKWFEIVVFAFLVNVIINNEEKEGYHLIGGILLVFGIAPIIRVLYRVIIGQNHFLEYRLFPSYESLLVVCLIFPLFNKNIRNKIFLITGVISGLLSGARAVLIGFISILFMDIFNLYKKHKKILLVVILILTLIALPIFVNRFKDVSGSNSERMGLLKSSFKMFTRHPVLGVGAGNYSYQLEKNYNYHQFLSNDINGITPHNVFAQYLAELGIIGFGIYAVILILGYLSFSANKNTNITIYKIQRNLFIWLLINSLFNYIAGDQRLIVGFILGIIFFRPTEKVGQYDLNYFTDK